jgi:putative membrane protein
MMMGMGFGFLGLLLFWSILLVVVIGGAILVFRQATNIHPSGGQHQQTACQVLDERLARGEIAPEEYEAIRARLES